MSGKRFTEEQVRAIVGEYDGGARIPDLCRRYAVSERTVYLWLKEHRPGRAVRVRSAAPRPVLVVEGPALAAG